MFDRKIYIHKSQKLTLEVQVHRTREELLEALDLLMPGARAALGSHIQGACLGVSEDYYYLLFSREGLHLETIIHELTHFTLQYATTAASEPDTTRYYPNTDIVEPAHEQVAIDMGVIGADILDWLLTEYEVQAHALSPISVERCLPAEENEEGAEDGGAGDGGAGDGGAGDGGAEWAGTEWAGTGSRADDDAQADDDALEEMYRRSRN